MFFGWRYTEIISHWNGSVVDISAYTPVFNNNSSYNMSLVVVFVFCVCMCVCVCVCACVCEIRECAPLHVGTCMMYSNRVNRREAFCGLILFVRPQSHFLRTIAAQRQKAGRALTLVFVFFSNEYSAEKMHYVYDHVVASICKSALFNLICFLFFCFCLFVCFCFVLFFA